MLRCCAFEGEIKGIGGVFARCVHGAAGSGRVKGAAAAETAGPAGAARSRCCRLVGRARHCSPDRRWTTGSAWNSSPGNAAVPGKAEASPARGTGQQIPDVEQRKESSGLVGGGFWNGVGTGADPRVESRGGLAWKGPPRSFILSLLSDSTAKNIQSSHLTLTDSRNVFRSSCFGMGMAVGSSGRTR